MSISRDDKLLMCVQIICIIDIRSKGDILAEGTRIPLISPSLYFGYYVRVCGFMFCRLLV